MFATVINLRHLTERIIPTKWRSYRDHRLRDVTSPSVYEEVKLVANRHVLQFA